MLLVLFGNILATTVLLRKRFRFVIYHLSTFKQLNLYLSQDGLQMQKMYRSGWLSSVYRQFCFDTKSEVLL